MPSINLEMHDHGCGNCGHDLISHWNHDDDIKTLCREELCPFTHPHMNIETPAGKSSLRCGIIGCDCTEYYNAGSATQPELILN